MTITLDGTLGITSPAETTTNLAYTGTLTGGTGIVNLGSGQVYKDASGNVGIGTSSPASKLDVSSSTSNIVASRSTGSYAAFQRLAPTGQQTYDFYSINGVEVARITGDPNYLAFATGSGATERMRIDSSGNLLVGTTSGSYKITCNGQPGANGYTAWTNYSDAKLKENVVDYYGGLSDVLKLRPVTFNYNELSGYDDETRKRRISGFIAQELKLIRPEMVGNTEIDGVEYYDTNTSDLNLLLIKAIQELKAIIDTQQARIEALEARV